MLLNLMHFRDNSEVNIFYNDGEVCTVLGSVVSSKLNYNSELNLNKFYVFLIPYIDYQTWGNMEPRILLKDTPNKMAVRVLHLRLQSHVGGSCVRKRV